jgi:Fur family ferric uptake transcriptional regulator
MKSTRNTTAKTEIQELILTSNVALSHSEIQKSLDGLCDRVTIYRVLERLLKDGGVKFTGYHSYSENLKHIHFIKNVSQ